jgi:hypothetical protein
LGQKTVRFLYGNWLSCVNTEWVIDKVELLSNVNGIEKYETLLTQIMDYLDPFDPEELAPQKGLPDTID